LDELLVRDGRQCPHAAVDPATGSECPEYERLFGVMLQQTGAVQVVIFRSICDRPTDLSTRQNFVVQVLPLHRQGRQVPVMGTGDSGAVCVGLLVTGDALQRRNAFAGGAPYYVSEMPVP